MPFESMLHCARRGCFGRERGPEPGASGQRPRGPTQRDLWPRGSSTWPRRDPSRKTRVLLLFAHATGLPSHQHPASVQAQLRARLLHPVAHFAGRRSSHVAQQRSRRSATASPSTTRSFRAAAGRCRLERHIQDQVSGRGRRFRRRWRPPVQHEWPRRHV